MKFSQNRFYVESYVKCANCGMLVHEDSPEDRANRVVEGDAVFCSQWCVDWKRERDARRAAGPA